METIVKNNDARANAIINPYLAWAYTQSWYRTSFGDKLYDKFGLKLATGYNNRQRLIDGVLLPEQKHCCCYCMRRMADHNDNATIEHIVPQSTTSNVQMNHYFSARSSGLNSANVCLTPDYVRNGSVAPPYPHHVAYHNFTVACKDCNSRRFHHKIEPLFLFAGIKTEVIYDTHTGEVEWIYDPVLTSPNIDLPTLEKVGLNRPLLKAIRAVWFYAKSQGVVPSDTNRNELIYGAFGESLSANPNMNKNDFDAFISLTKEEIWKLFLKYDYFGA